MSRMWNKYQTFYVSFPLGKHLIRSTTDLSSLTTFMLTLMFHISIFDSLYINKLIDYMRLLYGGGGCIRKFLHIQTWKIFHLSLSFLKGVFVNYLIWWIRKVMLETLNFLFQWWKKGRYFPHYMSDSRYKSGENTDIFVHIITYRLHYIYI